MEAIESAIVGSENLTRIFGYWPSFHDAEIIDLHLWRGEVDPGRGVFVFPTLTLTMHVWELTREVDADGYLILRHHTLTKLKFHTVFEDIRIEGFNQQNAIFGLSVTRLERTCGPSPYFSVVMEQACGMGASFTCMGVEVIQATPCGADGQAIPPVGEAP